MAFRVKTDESVRKGVRRIVAQEMDRAAEGLRERIASDPEKAIHEARKRFKRVRAVVRLVRDEVGEKTYRRENLRFRDAGRSLSSLRDAHALAAAFDRLVERYPDHTPPEVVAAVRQSLRARGDEVGLAALEAGPLEAVLASIEDARRRVKQWPVGRGFSALRRGLKRAYASGRKAFAAAAGDPSAEDLHEWRKRVKDLWHHLELIEPITPDRRRPRAERAHDLADRLGDDHDLAVLRQLLTEDGRLGEGDVQVVVGLIDRRRGELHGEAVELGQEVYRQRPRAFVEGLGAEWRRWRRAGAAAGQH